MQEQRTQDIQPERRDSWLDTHHANQQGDVIYVLRTAQQHHVMLGMIADQKANIILGAFLIFITVTQSILEKYNTYDTPFWILSGFFTVSAIFALLVITPRFRSINPKAARPDNLLFFRSFSAMSQTEYVDSLKARLENNEQARTMIMHDIYQIGMVLDKKYSNLRLSYISLGIGIIVSAITLATLHFTTN